MLNTVPFDPWQRSLFVPSVSSANTKEKGPLLAGNPTNKLIKTMDRLEVKIMVETTVRFSDIEND